MSSQYDIAIVGAGLVGNSLACALANTSYRIVIIDSQNFTPEKPEVDSGKDGRSIALALSSKKMMSALGLWDCLDPYATAIKNIHISDKGHFGATRLDCKHYDVESFGYLVPAEHLIYALHKKVDGLKNITRLQPYQAEKIESFADGAIVEEKNGEKVQAKLLIAADGSNSFIRTALNVPVVEKQYGQAAIVGSVECEKTHQNTAYERFTEDGPLALLPKQDNHCGFIWMNPVDTAKINVKLAESAFIEKLQQAFGYRLGKFFRISKRFSYPLTLSVTEERVRDRVVFIGNAAQTLHPIAGQGFNLALRDIAELSELLTLTTLQDVDDKLGAYQTRRQPDIEKTIRFTDRLNFLFNANYPVLNQTRGLGLAMLGAVPILEERIVKQNLGQTGSHASLLRGSIVSS